jgi:hypothetical protein
VHLIWLRHRFATHLNRTSCCLLQGYYEAGAIMIEENQYTQLLLNASRFEGNEGPFGGAVSAYDADVKATECSFTGNKVMRQLLAYTDVRCHMKQAHAFCCGSLFCSATLRSYGDSAAALSQQAGFIEYAAVFAGRQRWRGAAPRYGSGSRQRKLAQPCRMYFRRQLGWHLWRGSGGLWPGPGCQRLQLHCKHSA